MKAYEKVYYGGEMRTKSQMENIFKLARDRMKKHPDSFTSVEHKSENAKILNDLERIVK